MPYRSLAALLFVWNVSPILAADTERTLVSSVEANAAKKWQVVNDGVMGGRSLSRVRMNSDEKLEFSGTLSLANNGGFASIRTRTGLLGLQQNDTIVIRVRGDGRQYNFNLYTQTDLRGYSFRRAFKTRKDEWVEIRLPMDRFVATWRGRVFPKESLDPAKVAGLGVLLGDKMAGPFKLELDWIKVTAPPAAVEAEAIAPREKL